MSARLTQFLGLRRRTSKELGKGGLRKPQIRREAAVRFLREQDGPPERLLKNALRAILAPRASVARAYLARVDYGDPAAYEVALCIFGDVDPALVREVGLVFAGLAGRDAHLDILFLTNENEAKLKKVSRAFYEARYHS